MGSRLLDTEWSFPAIYFGVALLIVVALWAVGDGRTAGDFRGEVRAARHLLAEDSEPGVEAALRSLDPVAVEKAEATP